MATGALDTNGIWQYGEDDSEATFSALLNKLGASTSTQIGNLKTNKEVLQIVETTYTGFFNSSGASWASILACSITPKRTGTKLYCFVTGGAEFARYSTSGVNRNGWLRILNDTTATAVTGAQKCPLGYEMPTASSAYTPAFFPIALAGIHSNTGTSEIVFKVQAMCGSATTQFVMNVSSGDHPTMRFTIVEVE